MEWIKRKHLAADWKVKDCAIYLKDPQSILLKFDANNTFGKDQLSQTFFDSFKPSIKLSITKIKEDMAWDDLISLANKAEAKTKIQGSIHLD